MSVTRLTRPRVTTTRATPRRSRRPRGPRSVVDGRSLSVMYMRGSGLVGVEGAVDGVGAGAARVDRDDYAVGAVAEGRRRGAADLGRPDLGEARTEQGAPVE